MKKLRLREFLLFVRGEDFIDDVWKVNWELPLALGQELSFVPKNDMT